MSDKDYVVPIWERLTSQIYDRGEISYDSAQAKARNILIKRGHLNTDGTPTVDGAIRGLMTPEDRAIDRSMNKFGGDYDDYEYDPDKNYAYKKKR